MEWLGPNLDEIITEYKDKNLIIYPLSFTIDNSETLLELAVEYKKLSLEAGVKEYRVCRVQNDSDLFVEFIKEAIKEA